MENGEKGSVVSRWACALALALAPTSAVAQAVLFADGFERGNLADWNRVAGASGCPAGTPLNGVLDGDLGPAPGGLYRELACLEVRNDLSLERREAARSGIPLAQAVGLTDLSRVAVVGPGERRLAAQVDVLSRWSGPVTDTGLPIRWLQVTLPARIAASGTNRYSLRDYGALPAAGDPFAATVTDLGGTLEVDTGLATFTLDPADPALLTGAAIDLDDDGAGRTQVLSVTPGSGAGPRLAFDDEDLHSGNGGVAVDAGTFELVESGPARVVARATGHFSAADGTSLCTATTPSYERFGYTVVLAFERGSRDVFLQLQVRNECSDGFTSGDAGGLTDDAVTVLSASWELPLTLGGTVTTHWAGNGAVTSTTAGFGGSLVVEQRKGADPGSGWVRRARVLQDAAAQETAETLDRPLVALSNATVLAALQMPWMRFREPQALGATSGDTLSLRPISETLVVGEGKGIWSFGRLHLQPMGLLPGGDVMAHLEGQRDAGQARLERGLLVRASLPDVNAAGVFPSLGSGAASAIKTAYQDTMDLLHGQTVDPAGQWDRALTFGSQLWPDVQFNNYGFDGTATPFDNSGAMNYWNPSGAELLEFLRTGDPKWVWDFALPQSWLQTFSAYLNLGDRDFSNRNGVAVNSGGSGEGHWHRAAYGSDDYTYDLGMQLAYAVRPDVPMRDRFAQTGRTVVNRYSVPQVDEATRDPYINSVDVVRGVIQHFEALANCAEFVPAPRGQECHDRLETLVAELATDNLFGGTFCQGDVMNPTSCGMPQQFMTNAMHWMFFHRVWKNWGDAGGGLLSRALGEIGLVYYTWGAPKLPDGVSLDVDGVWAVLLDCTVSAGVVTGCTVLQNGDGDLLGPNIPHTVAFLLVANEVDPTIGLCDIARAAFDDPDLAARWGEHLGNDAGWWKGSAQMMQLMAFGIGGYDTCQDP